MLRSTRHKLVAIVCFVCALSVSVYEFFSVRVPGELDNRGDLVVSDADVGSLDLTASDLDNSPEAIGDEAESFTQDQQEGESEELSGVKQVKEGGPEQTEQGNLGESKFILCVNSGDTLMSMLINCGIKRSHAYTAIQALSKKFNVRRLKIGQEINLVTQRNVPESSAHIVLIQIKTAVDTTLCLTRAPDGKFIVKQQKLDLTRTVKHVTGTIETTFYSAVRNSGVPARIARQAANALRSEVNLRHAKPGDKFELIYAVMANKEGKIVKVDGLDYVAFAPSGKLSRMYRFKPSGSNEGFYNHKGQALSAATMCVPLKARYYISSRFGYRRDPFVRSVRKFHSGVDFAVPRGTPVYAAASGVVKTAGWHGGYGKFIKVAHNSNIATAYAHLSKILVKNGQFVKKGQLIAKVGSTGRSTSPHLHFEVRKRGKRVNPLKNVSFPVQQLKGNDKRRFELLRNAIMKRVEGIPSRSEVVATSAPS